MLCNIDANLLHLSSPAAKLCIKCEHDKNDKQINTCITESTENLRRPKGLHYYNNLTLSQAFQ